MNHIGDVNKLVSDTPRTDAELEFDPTSVDEVLDWSHQLERELNEANDRIKRLEAVTNDPHALWVNWLRGSVTLPVGIGDVREYQERIKRLEEYIHNLQKLGDSMALGRNLFIQNAWTAAKEANP